MASKGSKKGGGPAPHAPLDRPKKQMKQKSLHGFFTPTAVTNARLKDKTASRAASASASVAKLKFKSKQEASTTAVASSGLQSRSLSRPGAAKRSSTVESSFDKASKRQKTSVKVAPAKPRTQSTPFGDHVDSWFTVACKTRPDFFRVLSETSLKRSEKGYIAIFLGFGFGFGVLRMLICVVDKECPPRF